MQWIHLYEILSGLKFIGAYTPWIVLTAGIWTAGNGLLHTIFVLAGEHGRRYDRDLLRLLTDGLLLIVCGTVLIMSFPGLRVHRSDSMAIALAVSLAVIVYCALIWPFLKSVVTLLIHLFSLACIILFNFLKTT